MKRLNKTAISLVVGCMGFAASAVWSADSLQDVLKELAAVRQATLALLRGFEDEAWEREGTASGKRLSVRALAWMMAGHEAHHLRVLRERYL